MTVLIPHEVALLLLIVIAPLLCLTGIVLLIAHRARRRRRVQRSVVTMRAGLDELLEARTTVLPVIVPRNRPPGTLFVEHQGLLTPEPPEEGS